MQKGKITTEQNCIVNPQLQCAVLSPIGILCVCVKYRQSLALASETTHDYHIDINAYDCIAIALLRFYRCRCRKLRFTFSLASIFVPKRTHICTFLLLRWLDSSHSAQCFCFANAH